MTQRHYVLTEAAEADLRSIIRYTRTQWGNAQVRRYIATLERGMARLAAHQGAFRDMSALYPACIWRIVSITTCSAWRATIHQR